ncbi:MAG TPA: dTDP-4-dehydrorhamnose 3,5-epimerase [Bacteroidales bacterium]|nr:dTDP-4-dehydrorhamnose 3,5-epimerase [Bacteroidales bacterium]
MKITETGFQGLLLLEPVVFADTRGYFMESFNKETLRKAGIAFDPVQDNESSSVKGVIRGLHYQLRPFEQAKLIRVIEGKILDVVVDMRRTSKTFGQWFGVEISSELKKQLLIPRGFAHGFSVQSKTAVIQYKCDNYYRPGYERGIALNDPSLGIDWRTDQSKAIISEKDLKNPYFRDAENNF